MKQHRIIYFLGKYCVIIGILLSYQISVAQNEKTDSLLNLSKTLKGEQLIEVWFEIGKENVFTDTTFAKTYFNKAINLAVELEKVQKQIDLLNEISLFYAEKKADNKKAEEFAKDALKKAESENYIKGIAEANRRLAFIYGIRNDWGLAKKHRDISKTNYLKLNDPSGIIWCERHEGLEENQKGNYERALEIFQKCVKKAAEINDDYELYWGYYNISRIHKLLGNYSFSLEYLKKELEIKERINDQPGMAECYNQFGMIYHFMGDYAKSIEYYHKSLRIAEETGHKISASWCVNNIGAIYYYQGDYDMAQEYYKKALKLKEEISEIRGIAHVYNNLGEVSQIKKKYPEAIKYYQQAIEISDSLKENPLSTLLYLNIGDIKKEQKNLIAALPNYYKALRLATDIGYNEMIARSNWSIAEVYLANSNISDAIPFAEKGYSIAQNTENLEAIKKAAEVLANVYAQSNNYKKAYDFHKIYKSLTDSLVNEKSKKSVYHLKISYETEKKEQQITFLAKQNKNQKITNIIVSIALVLSVLIMILLYSRFKMRRKVWLAKKQQADAELEEQKAIQKQQELHSKLKLEEEHRKQEELKAQAELTLLNNEKLQIELDHSHRELSSSTMYAYQKNEILGKISEIIAQLTPENKETKEKVKELKSIVKNNLDDKNEWERLKLHFEKVHPEFFKRLQQKCPSLTQHEQKHCAYLRIKLSNKEIAALLNVSPKSMQMARYRLKKKMDLGADDDLLEMISKI